MIPETLDKILAQAQAAARVVEQLSNAEATLTGVTAPNADGLRKARQDATQLASSLINSALALGNVVPEKGA